MNIVSRKCVCSRFLMTAILLAGTATSALAQDGAYVVEPWVGSYSAVRIQPGDQKIVAAGSMYSTNPDSTTDQRLAIARYSSFGAPDTTYGIGGPSIPPLSGLSAPALGAFTESGSNLVFQPDGKAVVGFGVKGPALFDTSHGVARFTTGGALDSGFGGGGWTSLDALTYDSFPFGAGVGLQSTGKIVFSLNMNSSPRSGIVGRVKANGALDSGSGGFGPSPGQTGYFYATFASGLSYNNLAVQTDNKLVAVGYHSDSGVTRLHVSRYTANGSLDWTFNWSGHRFLNIAGISASFGRAVALQSNGKIVVAGRCSGIDGANDVIVARFNTNGSIDTSFGGGSGYVRLDVDGVTSVTNEQATAIAIQPDGKIVVAGTLYGSGSPNSVLVIRLNANGTPDATFGTGGYKLGTPPPGPDPHSFSGNAVALQSDGRIIVAGYDWDTSGNEYPLLMRFNP